MENQARMQKSLDYIEENLQTEITAAELADMAGTSCLGWAAVPCHGVECKQQDVERPAAFEANSWLGHFIVKNSNFLDRQLGIF